MLTQEALSMSCFSIYETINMPYLWPGQRLKILALTCCLTKRSQSFHCPPQKRKSETRLTTSVLKEIQNTQTVKQNAFCRTRQDKLPKRQILSDVYPRSGELQTQKFKSHLVRTQSLHILPLKPGVGQYIAIHAKLTARDFSSLISTLPVHSPAFFPKTSPDFTCVGSGQHMVPVQACSIKQATLPEAGSNVECTLNINRLKKKKLDLWHDDL